MRKHSKLCLLSLMVFLPSFMNVNAKNLEVNNIYSKLDEYIANHAGNNEITGAYIIGNHIFTVGGNFSLAQEDVMLAARTIALKDISDVGHVFNDDYTKDPIRTAMVVYSLSRDFDKNTQEYKWSTADTLVGNGKLPASMEIKYIDYTSVNDNTNTDEDMSKIFALNESEFYSVKDEIATNSSITIIANDETTKIKDISGTNLMVNLESLINKLGGIYSKIEIKEKDGEKTLIISKDTTRENIETLLGSADTKLSDLAGKSYTVTFTLAEDVANKGKTLEYTIKFKKVADIDKYFTTLNENDDNANIVFGCESQNGKNCKLTIDIRSLKKVTTETSSKPDYQQVYEDVKYDEAKTLQKLIDAIKNATQDNVVKSVDVKINGISHTYTKDDIEKLLASTITNEIMQSAKETKDELLLEDLIGMKFEIKFALNDEVAVSDKENSYSVEITATIDSEEQIQESLNHLNDIVKNNTTQNNGKPFDYDLKFKDGSETDILFELTKNPSLLHKNSNSDLSDVVANFYLSGLYKSVTVKLGNNSFVLGSNNYTIGGVQKTFTNQNSTTKGGLFLNYVEFLVESIEAEDGNTNQSGMKNDTQQTCKFTASSSDCVYFNLSKLAGKKLEIVLEDKANVNDEHANTTYTIEFVDGVHVIKDLTDLLEALKGSEFTYTNKENNYTIDIKVDEWNSKLVSTTLSARLHTLADNYSSIQVTIGEKTYTISKLAPDSYSEDLNALVTALTKKGDADLTLKDLISKKMTIKFNLKENTSNLDKYDTFNVDAVTTVDTNEKVSNALIAMNDEKSIKGELKADGSIFIDLLKPTTTIDSIIKTNKIKLSEQLTNILKTGLYQKIDITYNSIAYPITLGTDCALEGLDKFIDVIKESSLNTLVVDGFSVKFVLTTGVVDKNKTGSEITYPITLNNKLDLQDIVENNIFAKETNKNFSLVPKDNKVYLLYNDKSKKLNEIFGDTGAATWLKDIFNDTRIKSLVITIDGTSYTINSANTNAVSLGAMKILIFDRLKELFENNGVQDFNVATTTIGDVQAALNKIKMSLTLNLVEGEAVDSKTGNTSVVYDVVFSKTIKYNNQGRVVDKLKTVLTGIKFADNKSSYEVTADNKANPVDLSNLSKAFKQIITGSVDEAVKITFNNVGILTKSNSDADFLLELKKALGIEQEESVNFEKLIGKTITFTVTMADGVLSENANQSETYTITFVDKTNVTP